jgi:hypothetical protein
MAYNKKKLYITEQCPHTGLYICTTRSVAIDWEKSISNIISMSTLPKCNDLRIIDRIVGSNRIKQIPVIKTDEKKNEQVQDDTLVENFNNDEDTKNDINVFWNIISKINWGDTDERSLNIQHIKRVLNINEIRFILRKMENYYMPRLRVAVESVHLEDLVEENFNNVLAHIIMKGKIFYNGIILLPEVSLYLCDKFYPVYDWLHSN